MEVSDSVMMNKLYFEQKNPPDCGVFVPIRPLHYCYSSSIEFAVIYVYKIGQVHMKKMDMDSFVLVFAS